MQHLLTRGVIFAACSFLQKQSFSTFSLNELIKCQQHSMPSDFLKWGSVGFSRSSRIATGFTPLHPKPLDFIIDMDKAKHKTAEDLADIWDDYHLGRGHIGASMKAQLYHLLVQGGANCRYFVLPVWRGSGYITMCVQDIYGYSVNLLVLSSDFQMIFTLGINVRCV